MLLIQVDIPLVVYGTEVRSVEMEGTYARWYRRNVNFYVILEFSGIQKAMSRLIQVLIVGSLQRLS
ncbi:hypothetical protein EMQU_2909 (plasmid) [Enterococcus mundtii QU 25]|uniref:hypothetical protein n=1 Tax=Enterococcus mundtii TaxID=53346 RepID=UPI0003C539BB|nr:hypothetical protein [Enterococcus mundtii]BAO08466.1 hypothetical protein EMQU_2909 [Enterococcus mundtii QU 25]